MGKVPTLKSGLEFLLTRNSDVKKKGGFKKKGGKFPAKTRSKTPPILVRKPPQGRDSASRSGGLVGDHLCAEGEACERIRVRSARVTASVLPAAQQSSARRLTGQSIEIGAAGERIAA